MTAGSGSLGFALYLITDRAAARRSVLEVVEECLGAGLRAVQLREKDLAVGELLALATRLRESTRRHGARLIVNDRADVALAAEADGVHRTHASLPVAALRRIAPTGSLIGASVHSLDEARAAASEGADFIVFGPVYDTPSKRLYGAPQGLHALARVTAAIAPPVLAVGGITPARVREVLDAGARGVAVISAIVAAERPADATKAFLDELGRA
jgi:thiamine-phosphate pyrophosphorylase